MVYSSRFVLSVLVDGKPQKELANGTVPIQFSKCYSLRFRNKNDRRAVVKFTIDGEDVSGTGYIIQANSFVDIHRYSNKDATFKFVDLDSPEAIDHGKNGPNTDGSKGVIEAKFYLEKKYIPPVYTKSIEHHYWHNSKGNYWPHLPAQPQWTYQPQSNLFFGSGEAQVNSIMNCAAPQANINSYFCTDVTGTSPANLQEGCTVEGAQSGQTFISEYIDLETDFTLLRCVLKGFSEQVQSTQAEMYCGNCGAKKPRIADNFCGVCGRKF